MAAAAGTSADGAAKFIQSLADQAIAVLQSKDTTLSQRETEFRELLKRGFAIRAIGRFLLGPYWKKATDQQKEEYFQLISDWIVKTYAIRFGGYTNERFSIIGTRANPNDNDVFVASRIEKPGSSVSYKADWRVRETKAGYKIIDIEVDGISMALAQQSEFKSVARRNGIEGLLQILRQRIAEFERQSS